LKKKAPTNKERDQVIVQLIGNYKALIDKVFQLETILSLILDHDKELDKVIRNKIAEIEQSGSKDKEGT
jgi:hypothetical protein